MKINGSKKALPDGHNIRRKSPPFPEASSDLALVGRVGDTYFVHDHRDGTIGIVVQNGTLFYVVLGKPS